jgi:PAS domain S-box-containing protein
MRRPASVAATSLTAGWRSTGRGHRSSIRRRIYRILDIGLGLQVLLVLLITGAAFLAAVNGLRVVADRGTEVAGARVLAGMADQQSGLLAYVDSADPGSLQLYEEGRSETRTALNELSARGGSGAPDARVSRVEAAARSWQGWAEGMRLRVAAQQAPVTDPVATDTGRRLFATFRADQGDLVGELDSDSAAGGTVALAAAVAAGGVIAAGSVAIVVLLRLSMRRVVHQGLNPLGDLAGTARQIAADRPASIPDLDREDEVGELARALQGWQDASRVRTILVEDAPVGICRLDIEGRFVAANGQCEKMLGYPREELGGRPFWTFVHPDDLRRAREAFRGLAGGTVRHHQTESRWLHRDGSVVWLSAVAAPVLGADGRPETFIGILEDITDRKRQSERAAQIQRELLPTETPELEGYELAAACLPAQDVSGDFYDWMGPDGGQLDVTVADVMGEGAGSALVMATLRTALRTAPQELGPAARVGLAAESLSRGLTDDGLFVKTLQARLDVKSGVLRYVDAGHGHSVVKRANGEIERLLTQSRPLGIAGEDFTEGEVRLQPGDSLLACTDGLVKAGDRNVGLDGLADDLGSAMGAEEMVSRLVDGVRDRQSDDITVVVLRRIPLP